MRSVSGEEFGLSFVRGSLVGVIPAKAYPSRSDPTNILWSLLVFSPHFFEIQNYLNKMDKPFPAYYAVLDQSIAAFGDLLIGLFSVFQTIWISDRGGACESVCQFDFVQLLLNGLAQFDLIDVLQDEH